MICMLILSVQNCQSVKNTHALEDAQDKLCQNDKKMLLLTKS